MSKDLKRLRFYEWVFLVIGVCIFTLWFLDGQLTWLPNLGNWPPIASGFVFLATFIQNRLRNQKTETKQPEPPATPSIIINNQIQQPQQPQPTLTPNQAKPPPKNTIPPMSEIFVGREQILDHLIQGMKAGGTEIITGRFFHLTGAGGIGKSTLARYAANQCLDAFPDGAFEFLAAEHTPETLVMELAQELGEKPDEFRDKQEAGRYLNKLLANRKVLLLLDNLVSREDVPYLIPHNSPSSVIITTRDEECATKLDLERADLKPQVHKLEVFQDKESLALFRKVLKHEYQVADESIYLDIAECLGHLPLALRQALNLMVFRPNWSAQRLLDQLKSGEVLAILEKGRDKEGGDLRSLEAVYLLAEEWFDHEDAKTLMGYLAACAEGPVRVDFLETWCDVPELEERLGGLEARGWVTKHQVEDVISYEQHVLVRELFRNWVMTEKMEDRYLSTLKRIYTDEGNGYQVREAWLPQCKWAIERCGERRDERLKSWVYSEFRVFCETRGHGQLFLETGNLIKQTFPNDKWVLRVVYAHHALILKAWGKLEAAKELHEKEEAICEELGDRAGLARSYGNQALILKAWGKLKAAKGLHEKQEAICEELGDRAGLAKSYGNQALILADWGKLEAAKALHEKEEAICEELGDRAGLARSYGNQALILADWGKLEAAKGLHEKEEAIKEELGDRAGLAACYGNQAGVLLTQGKLEAAKGLYEKQQVICEEMGNLAGLARSYAGQALILKAWGKLEAAKELHEKEEAIWEELGDRAGLAKCYGNQALILADWGKLEAAKGLYEKVEAIFEELGDRAGLAITLWNLGALRADMGFSEEKTDYWRRSIAIKQDIGIPTADHEKALEAWLAGLNKPMWRKWLPF